MENTNLLEWVTKPEGRLKPLDLKYLDKHISHLLESSNEVEASVFNHPLSIVLVKFADGEVQCVQVDTKTPDNFTSVAASLDDWYAQYGIRAYSVKQTYDKRSFLVEPLESDQYVAIENNLPMIENHWSWKVPLSLYQMQVEIIEIAA